MRKKISATILAIAGFWQTAIASEDIEVHISDIPRAELSADQNERDRIYRSVAIHLPYNQREAYKVFTTLGKLSKLCDSIVVGNITQVEQPIKEANERNLNSSLKFNLNVETNLFGCGVPKNISLSIDLPSIYSSFKKNERVLVFLASEDFLKYPMEIHKWDFDKTQISGQKNDTLSIVGGDRGCISLESDKDEEQLISAVKGYLRVLSQKKPDINDYYDLLRQLVLSENKRIKEDARSDLLLLIQTSTAPVFDTKRVLLDDNIDAGIKDFLRFYWIPYVQEYRK
ncbi:MAG: hypothetical protein PHY48_16445 [Candidatus Cloacimonetes bacterium]|nr:hypothetical protein [Candidatus Cloacimonadota bacterium]